MTTQQVVSTGWTLLGWNNLGMHCMDSDFGVFSILPPYNTVHAQLVDPQGHLVVEANGIEVTYQAIADLDGSINSTSVGKGNFWEFALPLYGASLAADAGLAGSTMPGTANTPQPMAFEPAFHWFAAYGIPITPFDDAMKKNPYPLMHLVARDGSGNLLAATDVVLPVSDEMDCRACHASGSNSSAQPHAGWVSDPDLERDYRLNILRLHDEQQSTSTVFQVALATNGFHASGLFATVISNSQPILCASCHLSEALPGTGLPGITPLTRAMHAGHANAVDPTNGMTLDADLNRSACYRCHPGSETRCLRGAMGGAVAADGSLAMQCQSCHGSMSDVGSAARTGWLTQPNCQSCHSGTATHNNGQIRYTSAFESPGNWREAVDATFATDPDTPAAGFSLYRFSTGHGGLQCEACHGSTHAEYPSTHRNDNIQSQQLQGHLGMVFDCTVCHPLSPSTMDGGPHGMHAIGHDWVNGHGDAIEPEEGGSGPSPCRSCHGIDYKGTVLSRTKGERTFSTEFGTKMFWRGFQIGCYTCHNGPDSESLPMNHPPLVGNTHASTPQDTPVVIALSATDEDGNPLAVRVVSQPTHGTVGISGTLATFRPDPSFTGNDTFTIAAWDGWIDSNLGTVSVGVGNQSCAFALSTHFEAVPVYGTTNTITVTTGMGCDWTATCSNTWITILSGAAGNGSASVVYRVDPNPHAVSRSSSLWIAGQTVTVQQAVQDGSDLSGVWTSVATKCKGNDSSARCKIKGTVMAANGGATESESTTVSFYISDEAAFDQDSAYWLKDGSLKSIGSGQSKKIKLSVSLPSGMDVTGKYLIAMIDSHNVVAETDKANNLVVHGPFP